VTAVHVVVPEGIDDPVRPSGGNVYDRRICRELVAAGWTVHEHPVQGRAALAATLARLPDGATVLLDGLVASGEPEVLAPHAGRLRQVVLVHMPLGQRGAGAVRARERDVLRAADAIIDEEIRAAGLYESIWQSFGVLLPVRSVGVMGDARTYEEALALRAVHSRDGMTADWVPLPYDLLGRMSNRIINEVRGINRVVYDISSKPPATIEWE
jgi:hypothetical protein